MLCTCILLITVFRTGIGQHTDGDALRFTLYGGTHTWNEGLAICRSIGETMLHFHSTGDRDLFLKFSDKWTNDGQLDGDIWTGLYDNDVAGVGFQFVWDNCRIFTENGTLWSTVDTTEPNAQAIENCVRYAPYDGLKTKQCSIPFAVACQQVLGSCWFDLFDKKELNEPDLVGVRHSDLTLEQCQQTCLRMNTPDNLCIVFEFSSSSCKTFTGTSLYILETPAMKTGTATLLVLGSSSSVHVKRCYEGIYVETPPVVPGNSSDIPAAQCLNASLICTTTTTTASPTTLTTKSPGLPTTKTTSSTTTGTPVATTSTSTSITTASSTIKTSQTTSTTAIIKTSQTTAISTTTETSQTTSNAGTTITSQTTQTTAITSGPTVTSTSTKMSTTTISASNSTTTTSTTSISASTTTTTTEATSLSGTDNVTPTSPYDSKHCRLADRECLCIEYRPGDLAALEKLISSLVLDKKLLSSYRRKKTSAPDHRRTATSIGNLGIAFLALVFTGIILLDTGRVFRCLSSLKKTYDNVNNISSPGGEPRSSNEEGIA